MLALKGGRLPQQDPGSRATTVALVANTGWNIIRFRGVLIEALLRRGCAVVLVADFDPAQAERLRRLGAAPVALRIDSAGQNPPKDLVYLWRLARILRARRPDIVHLFTIKPLVYGALAARLAGVPAIVASVTGRGILSSDRRRWLQPVLRPLVRLALAGRTQSIFQNRDDLDWFVANDLVVPERASYIAGSGVDTRALQPAEGLPGGRRRTFVMASRMLWSKGVADFVEAARQVRQSHPDADFILFGGARQDYGSQNPDFIERDWLLALNREGIVSWRGLVAPDEVESAMRSAAAVVLPSYYAEGVPRALIEAAAAGAPIITTDMPGCRDTVVPDRSGLLVPPRSPEQIANAMRLLLDHPARLEAMSKESRSLAVSAFDSELIVEQTFRAYAAAQGAGVDRGGDAWHRA
jgi:glycosyltransferase involved in cell wall biosynthesis